MDDGSLGTALANFLSWVPGQRGLANFAVFLLASGVLGVCVVVLDACSAGLGSRSLLGLTHGWRTTPKAAFMWFVGAFVASALGMAARIFEPTPLAALLAAVSWRTLLTKLLAMARETRHHGADEHEG